MFKNRLKGRLGEREDGGGTEGERKEEGEEQRMEEKGHRLETPRGRDWTSEGFPPGVG